MRPPFCGKQIVFRVFLLKTRLGTKFLSQGPLVACLSVGDGQTDIPSGERGPLIDGLNMAKLLIIDDEPTVSAALARLLRKEGHETSCVTSPGEAIIQLQHNTPDLVLMDLSMPQMDGLELLDAIVGDSRFFDVPVAVVSGRCDEESLALARKLGAREFILKGTDWKQMYARIKAQLPAPLSEPQPVA
jgi:CheY-like chemotaxis protein